MKETPLESGAVLGLQIAEFEDSIALWDAVVSEAVGVQIGGSTAGDFDLQAILKGNASQLKDVLLKLLSSKQVRATLWKCMSSCTYQPNGETAGLRIDRATFNDEKARGDYFPVAGEVAVFNLIPFVRGLKFPSSLPAALGPVGSAQKSTTG